MWILHFATEFFYGASSCAVVRLCSQFAQPVGGLIYATTSAMQFAPIFGNIYRFVVLRFLRLSFVFKLCGFLISSAGALLPIALCDAYFPNLMERPSVLWGAFLGVSITSFEIMDGAHLMELPEFHELLPNIKGVLKRFTNIDFDYEDKRSMMRFARAHFADMTVVNLFRLVMAYGLSGFIASKLGLASLHTESPHPVDSVEAAFSLIKVVFSGSFNLTGVWAVVINGFYGASLLFYTSFFLSLASRIIDETPKATLDREKMERDLEEFIKSEQAKEPKSEASGE